MTKEEIDKFFNTALYALIYAEKRDELRFKESYQGAMERLHDVWAITLKNIEPKKSCPHVICHQCGVGGDY